MFGSKKQRPQSSQYDFKGATILIPLNSDQTSTKFIQTHALLRWQRRHIQWWRWQAKIAVSAFPTSCQKRLTSSKAPSTEKNFPKRTQLLRKKTKKNLKSKSTLLSRNA